MAQHFLLTAGMSSFWPRRFPGKPASYVLLGRLSGARDSTTVIEALHRMIQGLPATLLRTITWDQGTEMAQHAHFTMADDCKVFFCDPHSPSNAKRTSTRTG